MQRELSVQWYPGHMTKAKRMMAEELKIIDVVVEMLDARIPMSGTNPMLSELIGNKPRVIALNKTDLADTAITDSWVDFYKKNNISVALIDSAKGKGLKKLLEIIKKAAEPIMEKWLKKGVKNRSIRVMIVGIPNVGKSSLINRYLGSAKVQAANTPGVTRGKQWLNVGNGLEILDTPGVLWPKFEDKEAAFALAVTGAIKDNVFDIEEATTMLVDFLLEYYKDEFIERFKFTEPFSFDAITAKKMIAQKRGCLRSGGLIDEEKVSRLLLKEFRSGLLGRVSFDRPV